MRSGDALREFLSMVANKSSMAKTIHHFIYCVIKVQRCWQKVRARPRHTRTRASPHRRIASSPTRQLAPAAAWGADHGPRPRRSFACVEIASRSGSARHAPIISAQLGIVSNMTAHGTVHGTVHDTVP